MLFHDDVRKSQYGACYALSSRSVLIGVATDIRTMQQSTAFFGWHAAYRSGVVTCRSALHVLQKTDGKRSPFLAAATGRHYSKWKASRDVADSFALLELERNTLLKEGRSAFAVEKAETYAGEPRILIGVDFRIGSEVLRAFATWTLEQISAIEDEAHWNRREARLRGDSSS